MKRTTVWCFIIAISVLPVTVFSKSNSTEETPNGGKRSLGGGLFFVGGMRPVGLPDINQGKEIQQKRSGDLPNTPPYFVSLFDPTTNTAIYSAYKVTPAQATNLGKFPRPNANWRNPPNVPGVNGAYTAANREAKSNFGAVAVLTRGHMNPSAINSFDKNFMRATFTLTNTVPQFQASNSGPWQVFERKIRDYAKNTCGNLNRQGTLYLLTGRSEKGLNNVPKPVLSDEFTVKQRQIKLVTPRAVWTAGCCVWNQQAQSFAVMSNNHYDKNQLHQTQMKVLDVQNRLSSGTLVDLFPGNANCALNNIAL
ncbi:uncharacterized protein LOC111323681 [Stylophora pistillata]|uniref:uncharacterized protein LOC111323681 n=1 Tax=Stylophora pistillata TaxID=50429 RepID=UPI000C05075B|nr:uncharacterized protein LOC111323681 [Stylophora pistillata]